MPPTIPDSARELIPRQILTMRMIVFALVMGVSTFGGFVVMTHLIDKPLVIGQKFEQLNLIMYGLAAVMIALRFIVPPMMFRAAKVTPQQLQINGSTDPKALPTLAILARYQTAFIAGCAFLEGAAFANLSAAMLTDDSLHLIVAAVLVLLILAQFPRQSAVEAVVEEELRRAEEDRSLGI